MNCGPRPKGQEAIKAWHRQKIIDATIRVITRHGIVGTTIARVVELAGVSMGLVNVHFKSKDALLEQVLRQMADDYDRHWREGLESAPQEPAAQLSAIILADFHPQVLNLKTQGVWFAFRAQARSRPEYLDLVGSRDRSQMQKTISLLQQINENSGLAHDPELIAMGLTTMLDGMWTDYFLYPNEFDREKALQSVFLFLTTMYPQDFSMLQANATA
ncbi:MAG: TetR family transcriptional regulator [Gammaproteobacteria bacterium]|nr:TetR family transcriptional regulator [Gammaproteobacteria bacterium]